MTVRLIRVIAFGSFAAATAADPIHHTTASAPFELSTVQLDTVSAGLTLVLPPMDGAATSVRSEPVPISGVGIVYGSLIELEIGQGEGGAMNLPVPAPVPGFSSVGPTP